MNKSVVHYHNVEQIYIKFCYYLHISLFQKTNPKFIFILRKWAKQFSSVSHGQFIVNDNLPKSIGVKLHVVQLEKLVFNRMEKLAVIVVVKFCSVNANKDVNKVKFTFLETPLNHNFTMYFPHGFIIGLLSLSWG